MNPIAISATKTGTARGGCVTGFAAALLFLVVVATAPVPGVARGAPDSFADLAERLLPSVVNISTTQVTKTREGAPEAPRVPPGSPLEDFFKEFFDRQQRQGRPQRRATSLGSGFIIDAKGLVVTNNHVIAEADEISVILHDDTRLKAVVVGRDAKTDLALLRVKPEKPLKAVSFGNSDRTRVGDWVVAIGNPFGLGGTVTAGIVSARARNINAGPYDDFIQTDASINRGNSGGPMFNLDGKVIGINTAIFSPSGGSVGIGFAIPSKLAEPVVNQLLEFGRARRGWLGVRIQTVTQEIAQGLGLDDATGALVANVTEGGPAEKAKVEVGDVILKFDGKTVSEMRQLPRIVAETPVGKESKLEIWRQGEKVILDVKLGEFPEDEKLASAGGPSIKKPERPRMTAALGLMLSPVTPELRQRFKLDEKTEGVIVTEVKKDTTAAEKRVQPGDIVRKIGPGHEVVKTPAQIKDKIDQARKNKMKSILFLFERDGNSRFVALRLDDKKDNKKDEKKTN